MMRDPQRLLETHEIPLCLREALLSLEQAVPDPATLSRVRQRLGCLPPAPRFTSGFARTLVVLVATLAAIVAVAIRRQSMCSTAQYAVATTLPMKPADPRRSQATAREPVHEAPHNERRDATSAVPHGLSAEPAARRAIRAASRSTARAAMIAQRGDRPSPATSFAALNEPELRRPNGAAAQQAAADTAPIAAQPTPAPQPLPAPPEDEAAALYRVKQRSAEDPSGELRMLQSLAHHFPNGALRQERDVLTIRLHERLGHKAQAQRLAAQFQTHFPGSVYRNAMGL